MPAESPTRTHHLTILVVVLTLALAGCGDTSIVDDSLEQPPTGSTRSAQLTPAVTATNASPEAVEGVKETSQTELVDESLSYEPPFPERFDLFVPPKRTEKRVANNRQEGNVELIGFATVEGREVVLSVIDGSVFSIAEGETCYGVEVISIKQPAVVLQRGRQKWQVSLSN